MLKSVKWDCDLSLQAECTYLYLAASRDADGKLGVLFEGKVEEML